MKTYKENITSLKSNQIFVFGSNTQGRHGKGAALFAIKNCGAIYGQAKGLQGQSYAIITKDLNKNIHPSIRKIDIIRQILDLYKYAESNQDKEFLIAYKGNTINLNGYTPEEMAKMFSSMFIPNNIVFEESFSKLL